MISASTLKFLAELKHNNNRDWMHANSNFYREAKTDFLAFVSQIIKGLSEYDKQYKTIDPAACLFRLNRDVRFSANKAPYKTNFAASVNPKGKKSFTAGLYLHIEPANSFVGGGIYMPPTPVLNLVRQEIDYNTESFLQLIQAPEFVKNYKSLDMSQSLKNVPKQFNDNPAVYPYIKLKSFVALKNYSNKQIQSGGFVHDTITALHALLPLIHFLNRNLLSE